MIRSRILDHSSRTPCKQPRGPIGSNFPRISRIKLWVPITWVAVSQALCLILSVIWSPPSSSQTDRESGGFGVEGLYKVSAPTPVFRQLPSSESGGVPSMELPEGGYFRAKALTHRDGGAWLRVLVFDGQNDAEMWIRLGDLQEQIIYTIEPALGRLQADPSPDVPVTSPFQRLTKLGPANYVSVDFLRLQPHAANTLLPLDGCKEPEFLVSFFLVVQSQVETRRVYLRQIYLGRGFSEMKPFPTIALTGAELEEAFGRSGVSEEPIQDVLLEFDIKEDDWLLDDSVASRQFSLTKQDGKPQEFEWEYITTFFNLWVYLRGVVTVYGHKTLNSHEFSEFPSGPTFDGDADTFFDPIQTRWNFIKASVVYFSILPTLLVFLRQEDQISDRPLIGLISAASVAFLLMLIISAGWLISRFLAGGPSAFDGPILLIEAMIIYTVLNRFYGFGGRSFIIFFACALVTFLVAYGIISTVAT